MSEEALREENRQLRALLEDYAKNAGATGDDWDVRACWFCGGKGYRGNHHAAGCRLMKALR